MRISWQFCSRCATLLVHPDYTHWPSRKCETDGERPGKMDRSGWMGSLFGRRREEGPLVLVCGRQPAASSVYINVLILNWLWGSQRLENSWERNKKQSDGRTLTSKCDWFIKNKWLHCFFFSFLFLQNGDKCFKLKWNTSKSILKMVVYWYVGGLTLCPLVSGDRKMFLFNVLF